MATEELQTVQMSDGCGIKVKILGEGSNKPLMIAHHGAPGLSTHKEPEVQFSWLAETFKILLFDMRGCGASDKKRPYTHKQWVQDVDELR
jgi:proline iminopeptidase